MAQAAAIDPPALDRPTPGRMAVPLGDLGAEDLMALLVRAQDGDPSLAPELRRRVRQASGGASPGNAPRRRLADLRAAADRLKEVRASAARARAEAERRRLEKAASAARRERLVALAGRGMPAIWREMEAHVLLRNAKGYGQAVAWLGDLRDLASREGEADLFEEHLAVLRERHQGKPTFIMRLDAAGLG
jgi:hypothetical protein